MADNTTNLQLPFIVAAQAQKHVTHNAALQALDAIVMLSVLDRDLAAPPGSPADGARYLVAASPSGGWAGQAGKIAAYQDGAWSFLTAKEGWQCWIADEDLGVVFDGSAWQIAAAGRSAHGAAFEMRVIEEELTLSGASVTSTAQIPAGSICLGVSERVTQAVTGATSFSVGVSGEAGKFGASLGLSLGSTNYGIIGPTAYYANTGVVVTAAGGAFTGGRVRIAIHCIKITPPQS